MSNTFLEPPVSLKVRKAFTSSHLILLISFEEMHYGSWSDTAYLNYYLFTVTPF